VAGVLWVADGGDAAGPDLGLGAPGATDPGGLGDEEIGDVGLVGTPSWSRVVRAIEAGDLTRAEAAKKLHVRKATPIEALGSFPKGGASAVARTHFDQGSFPLPPTLVARNKRRVQGKPPFPLYFQCLWQVDCSPD